MNTRANQSHAVGCVKSAELAIARDVIEADAVGGEVR
jgi:hypothetical protein